MLRRLALVLALPSALAGQGRVIIPCDRPIPMECGPGRCAPVRPTCGPALVRTQSQARVALRDRVLHYEVTETFVNRGATVAEADYLYPLPPGAAFEDLKLSINGELVSGETMSADRARGIYEEIVRRQRDPALIEWMGSGLLRARIFPIQPGEEKKVVVRFQSVAQREGDALRINYRRGSDPSRVQQSSRPTDEDEEWTTFALLYEPGEAYGAPYSPTHTLRTRDEGRGRTRLVEARGAGRDVTVLIPLRRAETASLSVLTHAVAGEKGFALLTITPPAVQRAAVPRDVTFIVDVSGSMRGAKLQQAKEAGYALLSSLRPEDRFRIIDFSTDVRSFRTGFVAATPDQLRDARVYLRDLKAEGSTNISGALEEAFRTTSDGERLPLAVFITDGEPTVGERSPDRIAEMAAQRRGSTRLFSIGVSAEVNASLVEQLAVRGGGLAHFVRDDESVEHTTSVLARRLASPVLTDVRIDVDGVQLSHVLPAGPIDIFGGQDVVVLARYSGNGPATVRLRGRSPSGPVTWSTQATFAARDADNGFIPRLWAAQRIGWLASAEKRQNGSNA